MKRFVVLSLLVILLVTSACAARSSDVQETLKSDEGFYAGSAPPAEPMEEYEAEMGVVNDAAASTADIPDRMIVYTGALDLVVKDTQTAQDEVTQLVDRLEGYVFSSESYRYGEGLVTVRISLRVPAESFNEAMSNLRDMAVEVTRDSVSTEDVTQEYVDLDSRLRALEVKAERLEALMEEAEDTEAVLQVYQELSATQQEIEQVKGRMRYLERSSAMATINLSLTPDELAQPIEVAGWRPQGTLKQAVQALINTYQFLVDALIWILILVIPVLAGIGLVIYGLIKVFQRLFKRRKPRDTEHAKPSPAAEPKP